MYPDVSRETSSEPTPPLLNGFGSGFRKFKPETFAIKILKYKLSKEPDLLLDEGDSWRLSSQMSPGAAWPLVLGCKDVSYPLRPPHSHLGSEETEHIHLQLPLIFKFVDGRLLVHFLATQTPEIITQKSLLLASLFGH